MALGFGGWQFFAWQIFAHFPIVEFKCHYWGLSSTSEPNPIFANSDFVTFPNKPQLAHVPPGSRLFRAIAARFELVHSLFVHRSYVHLPIVC